MAPLEAGTELALVALPGASDGAPANTVARKSTSSQNAGSELIGSSGEKPRRLSLSSQGSKQPNAPEGFPASFDDLDEIDERSIFLEQYKTQIRAKQAERRQPVSRHEARRAMSQVKFFQDFEVVIPGVLDELAKVALCQIGIEGEVLFRQGDPAVDCYVVLEGKVGVYVRSTEQDSPRDIEPEEKIVRQQHSENCPCFCFAKKVSRFVIKDTWPRYVTECQNTYTPQSNLGIKVSDLIKGSGFGELGLLDKKPRAASIKCIERTTLLVLLKEDFIRLLGDCIDEKSFRKQLWFQQYVPGFADCQTQMKKTKRRNSELHRPPTREFHPTDCFREWEESCGHIFLAEGSVADPLIVVIKSGHVDFVRRVPSPAVGKMMLAREHEVQFTRLSAGQIFCSLGVFGLRVPEPFTARISSEKLQYFVTNSQEVRMLPEMVHGQLLEHVRISMRPLLCYSSAFVGLDHLGRSQEESEPGMKVLRPPFAPEKPLKPPVKYSLNPTAPIEHRQVTFRPPQLAWR